MNKTYLSAHSRWCHSSVVRIVVRFSGIHLVILSLFMFPKKQTFLLYQSFSLWGRLSWEEQDSHPLGYSSASWCWVPGWFLGSGNPELGLTKVCRHCSLLLSILTPFPSSASQKHSELSALVACSPPFVSSHQMLCYTLWSQQGSTMNLLLNSSVSSSSGNGNTSIFGPRTQGSFFGHSSLRKAGLLLGPLAFRP